MTQRESKTGTRADKYHGNGKEVLQMLLDTKPEHRWLRKSVFTNLSERLDIQVSEIHRVLGMVRYAAQEIGDAERVINKRGADKSALLQILLDIQKEKGWLSNSVLVYVSHRLEVPISQLYQVATFYKAFRLDPPGRHLISVCLGTNCETRDAPSLLKKVTQVLKVQPGQTTKDMKFRLEAEDCLGCCAIGPVMVVDDKYYSRPSAREIKQIIAACE